MAEEANKKPKIDLKARLGKKTISSGAGASIPPPVGMQPSIPAPPFGSRPSAVAAAPMAAGSAADAGELTTEDRDEDAAVSISRPHG